MTYNEVRNDAGLFREYLVKRFGGVLTHGGLSETYFLARKLVKRLAKLIGSTYEEVLSTIQNDYRNQEEF
jgi:hypothetical protein